MNTKQLITCLVEEMYLNTTFSIVIFSILLVFIISIFLVPKILALWKPKKRVVQDFKKVGKTIKDHTSVKRKRNIIKLALILILVVGLYPPWIKTHNKTETPIGHHLIFKPPKSDEYYLGFKIDAIRTLLYLGMILITAGGLFLIPEKPE